MPHGNHDKTKLLFFLVKTNVESNSRISFPLNSNFHPIQITNSFFRYLYLRQYHHHSTYKYFWLRGFSMTSFSSSIQFCIFLLIYLLEFLISIFIGYLSSSLDLFSHYPSMMDHFYVTSLIIAPTLRCLLIKIKYTSKIIVSLIIWHFMRFELERQSTNFEMVYMLHASRFHTHPISKWYLRPMIKFINKKWSIQSAIITFGTFYVKNNVAIIFCKK